MVTKQKSTITIIGAGIAGCFTAILLAKRGYKVKIYERTSREEICNTASKRSFNLTFLGYGVQALKEAGLWEAIEPNITLLDGSITQVTKYSEPRFSKFEKEDMPYYSTERRELLDILIQQAIQQPLISFQFDTAILSIDRYTKTMIIQNQTSKKVKTVTCDVILGTDGVNSIVRSAIQQGQETTHTQEYATWNYKQVVISKEVAKKLSLQKNIMHAWTRKYAVLAAFPHEDGSYATILMLPKGKKQGFAGLTSKAKIRAFVKRNFPDMSAIIPTITDGILNYPEGSFVMVHTDPWYYKDFMAILGDAAHGFFPFFGQGMSAAFGDGLAIARLVDTHGDNWEKIFPLYQENRKKHMDALGELSKKGLVKYRRNKVADYDAIYDKLEFMLHTIFPKYIQPPLFVSVATDPDHTADHVQKYTRQKRITTILGFSLLVYALTGILAIKELISDLAKQKSVFYGLLFRMVKKATAELTNARKAVILIAHRNPKMKASSIDLLAITKD